MQTNAAGLNVLMVPNIHPYLNLGVTSQHRKTHYKYQLEWLTKRRRNTNEHTLNE